MLLSGGGEQACVRTIVAGVLASRRNRSDGEHQAPSVAGNTLVDSEPRTRYRCLAKVLLALAAGCLLGGWLRPSAADLYHAWRAVAVQAPPPLDPQSYAVKVAQFRRLDPLADRARVVYLGDSITDWMAASELLSVEGGAVLNRAISGDTTGGVLARVTDTFPAGVAVCFLMIGRNDLGRGAGPNDTADRIMQIAQLLVERHRVRHVVVESVLPFAAANGAHALALNDRLRRRLAAKSETLSFLDLYSSFLRGRRLDESLYADYTHLNERGIELRLRREIEHLARVVPDVRLSLNVSLSKASSAF